MTEMTQLSSNSRSLLTRTLWRIEAGLNGPLSLGSLAEMEEVSPFHLSRAFSLSFGQSVMAYVKARRLSEAAKALTTSPAKIVEIAFAAGYDSHEGFSRAFREHFGHAPRELRAAPNVPLILQEAIIMPATELPKLSPEIVNRSAERLVGRARRYTMETRTKIPQLWEETAAEIGPPMFGITTFGACYDFDDDAFTYLVGMADDGRIDTDGFDHLTLPAGEYAVFQHTGHISSIAETWTAIFEGWMPKAEYAPTDGPEFEVYQPDFDLEKPGGVSIWIPVTKKA